MSSYKDLNQQYINGNWTAGTDKGLIVNLNPYTNEIIHTVLPAAKTEVDAAYEAAKKAFSTWSNTNPLYRRDLLLQAAALLQKRKDEFVEWLCKETGSTFVKSVIEVQQAHDILVEASSFPTRMHGLTMASTIEGKEHYVYRTPIGVIGLISPWNWPLYLSMRTIAPALGAGNTIVVKPSTSSLATGGTLIAKLLEEAGFPTGVFNVIVGNSDTIGDYFTGHRHAKMISFTGSTPVGTGIGRITGEKLKKSALELGGNNAFIVLDDASVEDAVDAAIFGKFLHQGQLCISVNRILVHEHIFDSFKERFIQKASELPVGDPANPATIIGPVIDAHSLERILKMINDSVDMGATVELGNKSQNNILFPTVLSDVNPSMPIFRNEIFGPAVGLVSFSTDEEAVALANATDFGLSGTVFTRDLFRGMQLARQLETGMVHVNDQTANDEVHAPFGGEKSSGTGRFGGSFILDELTKVQWVSVQKLKRQFPF